MGAQTFTAWGKGTKAAWAFTKAREQAAYNHGHDGYTGTIAEKDSFVLISFPAHIDITKAENPSSVAMDYAEQLIETNDKRISDKWGPAGCLDLKNGKYLFFGCASS